MSEIRISLLSELPKLIAIALGKIPVANEAHVLSTPIVSAGQGLMGVSIPVEGILGSSPSIPGIQISNTNPNIKKVLV